ncbi:translocation/assembly module TamB [Ensifer adhaerens]|uniref:translocation/assembly module TamB domain-containing protein n=1 Tax=Ensifer adhaerens TaxID=106592 RepID=UPI001CBE207F|nr:translocation/assembly module TamB domain-containing protein [Ensifer adhaerens]MBZ7923464.1 translocation/assembly module TamB [Ensifer adhaerens]UAX92027.1 translocation/assembly module TamB [Ensifer adhaerens]UAX99659.1 translocation/assembly module TamB [Ensifer adhaerens]UAY07043.1 translocation/assembly module TamB [Ensifer adhaerens]
MNQVVRFLRATLRYGLRVLGVIAVVALLLVAFVGFTTPGARLVAWAIEKYAATPDQIVRIADPSALLTGEFAAGSITLFDGQGVYAEVRDLKLNWSPAALLSFRFDAAAISAGSVRVERLPIPSTETKEVRSTFALPVDVKIDAIDLKEIVIGKAIAGEDQFLTAGGKINATNESIALSLTAAQRDRPEARAVADIVFNPAGNELKLEATVDEPNNGVLAKLLRLPNEPAVNIKLTGQGPLSDWAGTATAALDGSEILKLDGRHLQTPDGMHRLTVTGGGGFGSLMPPALRPMFEGETSIDVAAAFNGQGMVRVDKGQIATGALTFGAFGTFDSKGDNNLQARLAGTNGAIDFRWPLQKGEAQAKINAVNLSLIGGAQAAILDLAADVASVALPDVALGSLKLSARSDGFNLQAQSGAVKTALEVGEAGFNDANLARLVQAPMKVDASLAVTKESISFDPVTIESPGIGGSINGTFSREENTVAAAFKLFAVPGALPPAAAAKFDGTIALAGEVKTANDGSVTVEGLELKSSTIEAAGTVALAQGQLTTDLKGKLPNLGRLLADAKGEAEFTAAVTGPLAELGIKAELTSSGATLAGRTLSDLTINADAKANPSSPQASLTATGALDGQVIDVKADVVSKDGRTAIPVLEARIGENKLTGTISFTPDFKPDGTIDFNLPDLGLLAAMAGQKASGDLNGSAAIKTANGITSVVVKAGGSGIKRDELTIAKPTADITISDVAALAIKGSVRAETVAQGANRVAGLAVDFQQQAGRTGFSIDGKYDGGPLTAKGDLTSAKGRTEIRLASFGATPKGVALKLAQPTVIAIENGTVRLNALTIQASNGTITVNGSAGEKLDIAAKLNALPAALVNAFAPDLGAEGTIAGTVNVSGAALAPIVAYDLRWSGASLAAARTAGVSAFDIAADGKFANNKVTLDTTLSGAGGLSFKGGGNVDIGGNMPIAMKFNGNLPFALIANLMAEKGFTLTGRAGIDLTVSGSAKAPQIAGTLTTSGGRLVDVRRNLALNDLTANVALDGKQATISKLSANLATGGSIEATGTVGTVPGSGFPANLTIRLNNATYVDGTLFNANLAGELTLTGPLVATPTLGGKVTIRKASITIPEKLPTSLSAIDIKHKNAPPKVQKMVKDLRKEDVPAAGANASGVIAFDLAVNAQQVFVRGRGIDAELGGDLTIRGTAVQPSVSGGFEMRRGRLEILGKRLTFTDGNIGFGGDLIPTLDLKATSSVGATTITVSVAGLANNPQITFSSSPALPQDEILAQLIFNRSLSNLSAFQIAQLASAVSQLAGGGSTSLLDGLRNKLGVDDLDVTTDENGGASVRAGKYLNDRTYIELQQGSDSASSKAVINLDVGKGVKLKGSAAGDGSAAGGIFFEKEY